MSWQTYNAEAVAVFPYDSAKEHHLKVLGGDRLTCLKKCGQWVYARCNATSCVGICPLNRIAIISDEKESGNTFDLLVYEAQCLFGHVFSKYLVPTRHPDDRDMFVMDLVKRSLSMLPLNEGNRAIFAKNLDEIRKYFDQGEGKNAFQVHRRNKEYEILRTHDIRQGDMNWDNAQDAVKSDSIFPKTIDFRMAFTLKHKEDLRLVFRIYDNQKDELVSAPCDVLLPANTEEEQVLHFMNIEAVNSGNLVLVVRALTSKKFGVQGKGPWATEYVGVAVVNLKVGKDGDEAYLNCPFYTYPEGSQLEVPKLVLSQSPKVFRIDDMPSLVIKLSTFEGQLAAESPSDNGKVTTFKIPAAIAPGYHANSYFLKIENLQHKTKLKRTRVTVRVLDVTENKFLPIFKRTLDPTEFATVVQKGFVDMQIDEIADLDLDVIKEKKGKCYLLFEVQRTSRSKGDIHLSAYAFCELTTDEGVLIDYSVKKTLSLIKPQQAIMTVEDYANAVNVTGKSGGSELTFSARIHSSVCTSSEAVHKLIRYEEYKDELQKDGGALVQTVKKIDLATLCLFLDRLLLAIGHLVASGDEILKATALEAFVSILLSLDQPGALSKVHKHFFDHFISTQFTAEHSVYATFYHSLFEYIVKSLEIGDVTSGDATPAVDAEGESPMASVEGGESPMCSVGGDVNEGGLAEMNCKSCCRCLGYFLATISASLRLNREMKNEVNEAEFKQQVRDIFAKLANLMASTAESISISKSFVCRAVPLLRDVISDFFDENEGTELVINFIGSVKKCETPVNKGQISTHLLRLIRGVCEAQFFEKEQNMRLLVPIMLSNLTDIEGTKFKKEICQIVQMIFFAMMKSTLSFSDDAASLLQFIPLLLEMKMYNYFILILLYFCDASKVEAYILENKYKERLFNQLVDLVLNVAIGPSPTFFFFVTTGTLISLVSMSQKPQFDFVHRELHRLIASLASFYNAFLNVYESMPASDRLFFNRVYVVDLEPIAALLPSLLKSVPVESRFNASVLLPLFHFYVHQDNQQTRESILDGFFLLLDADFTQNKNFEKSENAIAIAMDSVSKSTQNISVLKQLFHQVRDKFGARKTQSVIESFLKRQSHLVGFMNDLNQFPNEKLYEDERATAIMSVLNTCKQNNDFLLFAHFASKLYELHLLMDNKTEAAESLVLAADIFKWDEKEMIPEGHGFPQQPKSERKRNLLHQAVKHFMESDFYERALDILGILKQYYEEIDFDYLELAELYKLEAKCWESVCNPERNILNRFYGVRFYGSKFSSYFKDTLYIYRRNGFFMNDQMMRELKEKFPDARIDPKPPSDEDLKDPELYYIHIFNVKPRDLDGFDPYLPPSELMVKQVCNISEFYSETPIRKRRDGDYGEFAEWHRHIYKYTTNLALQGPVRRAKVVTTSPVIELSPIECAVLDTNAKTIELMQKACMYWRCLHFHLPYNEMAVSSFSMLMSGIVNAAVNGGTKVFQDLFLEGPLKDEPLSRKHGPALKTAFADQLKAVDFALKIHPHVMSAQYQGLHENVVENFEKMREVMEPAIGKVDLDKPAKFGEIPPFDPEKVEKKASVVGIESQSSLRTLSQIGLGITLPPPE